MSLYCSECERPLAEDVGYCPNHRFAPIDTALDEEEPVVGCDEEPTWSLVDLEDQQRLSCVISTSDEDSPISYHLTEVATKVAALEARLTEVQNLARRADDALAVWQNTRMDHFDSLIGAARLHLTKALETL